MKKGGGSKKGSPYERAICTQLSLWWTGGERDDVFWRTSGSGGRATRRGRKGLSTAGHCGDIGASDPIGEPLMKLCAWEVKRGYSRFTIQDILDAPKLAPLEIALGDARKPLKGVKRPEYLLWMDQAEQSRLNAKAIGWAIIVRRDKRASLILVSESVRNGLAVAASGMVSYRQITHSVELWLPDYPGVGVYRLDEFLNKYTPRHVRAAVGMREVG